MANIIIKDLTESVDLDRKAMTAIIGGARAGGRQAAFGQDIFQVNRLVNYPAGFQRNPLVKPGPTR